MTHDSFSGPLSGARNAAADSTLPALFEAQAQLTPAVVIAVAFQRSSWAVRLLARCQFVFAEEMVNLFGDFQKLRVVSLDRR